MRCADQGLSPCPLVALKEPSASGFKDRRFHRVERGKHPCDRARPGIGIVRQQARMALRDVEHDRPRLEPAEIAFFTGKLQPLPRSANIHAVLQPLRPVSRSHHGFSASAAFNFVHQSRSSGPCISLQLITKPRSADCGKL